jgi:hypothetical protein
MPAITEPHFWESLVAIYTTISLIPFTSDKNEIDEPIRGISLQPKEAPNVH